MPVFGSIRDSAKSVALARDRFRLKNGEFQCTEMAGPDPADTFGTWRPIDLFEVKNKVPRKNGFATLYKINTIYRLSNPAAPVSLSLLRLTQEGVWRPSPGFSVIVGLESSRHATIGGFVSQTDV